MSVLAVVLLLATLIGTTTSSHASVVARIDLSSQRMHVSVDGAPRYIWRISTGRKGYRTPTGSYRPWLLKRMHYSSKYHGSPMPHSIFFRGGYAIHGTYEKKRLGRPASHGCVRLHPSSAAVLYSLVRRHGMQNTRIIIRY
ncbi:MAG: L,D-transpeptidase [Methyloligellaceae bacterium]